MSKRGKVGDQLRVRLRTERERRGWSQSHLAKQAMAAGTGSMHPATIAKIEAGDRGVQIDEAVAFANIFGVSVDALVGRVSHSGDLMWAISKLTGVAHKSIPEIDIINQRIVGELKDVCEYAQYERRSIDGVIQSAAVVCERLSATHEALTQLADQFPLPGRG